jgi:hypothetical protein
MPPHGSTLIPDRTAQLAEAFQRHDWPAVSAHAEAVLRGIADAPEEVVATAHPLGFVHILLCEREDGSRLRLHLWPREPFDVQSPSWAVHQHGWPLTSLVVRGSILDERYAVGEDPAGAHRLYVTGYEGDRSVLRPTDRTVCCELNETSSWAAGSVYRLASDDFHASRAEIPSVTVVESGTPAGSPPLVVGVAVGQDRVVYKRRELDTPELVRILAEVMLG